MIKNLGSVSAPKKLHTLDGKLPSAFVRPVVGEGSSTLTDSKQKTGTGIGELSHPMKWLMFFYFSPRNPKYFPN